MSADLQKNDLFNAAKKLDAKAVEYCIKHGLDPNSLDLFGKPPLYYVIKEGYGKNSDSLELNKVRETIHVLLSNGAGLNNLNKKEKSHIEDYMRGYKGKKIGLIPNKPTPEKTAPEKPIIVNPILLLKKENESFYEAKERIFGKNNSLLQNFNLGENVHSFLEKHLESILLSLLGFLLPYYLFKQKGLEITSGDTFWSMTGLFLILPILVISILLLLDFWKEKKFIALLQTIPSFFSSLVFILFLFYLQFPQVQQAKLIEDYRECFSSNIVKCTHRQMGIYEDFLFSKERKYLREDNSVLHALGEGIRPHSIWKKLGDGHYPEQKTLQQEFARRGLVFYLSQLGNGKSPDEIFSSHEWNWVFYSIAFGEANPDLLALTTLPEEWKSRLSPSEEFPVGILNQDRVNVFYQTIIANINGLSSEETELAVYFLTQFSVNLDENYFQALIDHWITFNKQYEKELKYVFYIRSQIRNQLLEVKKDGIPVGVKFNEDSYFEFYKPFLRSTGVDFTKGEDKTFGFQLLTETVSDTNHQTITRLIFSEILPMEKEIFLYTLLDNGLTPEVKELYKTTGEETWIYALPASLVCKTCK